MTTNNMPGGKPADGKPATDPDAGTTAPSDVRTDKNEQKTTRDESPRVEPQSPKQGDR